ncbi:MAG: C40 family peptidase [Micromonosporaceae bacterium]|nr:C40 family peptidase [Micromonosporaceae bacterium]
MTSWRTLVRAIAAAGVAVFVGLLPAAPAAHAEPNIDQIEAELDKAWEKIEPLIEQYNKVHSQLQANQKKAAELQRKVRPLELQVDLAMTRVGEIAARQYMYGPVSALNAVLQTGSPTTLGDRLAMLEQIARDQRERIAVVAAARDKYRAEKQKLDKLVATQKRQEADLAARRKAIQANIDKLEKQRLAAYGNTNSTGGSLRIGACPAVYIGGDAGVAVKTACAQIGKPYVFGANGPDSFDCSGLTQYAWGKAGVSLTHYTGSQWTEGAAVSRSNARPGDLVFFYSDHHHVGIYVGNGLMVHASRTGVPVKMAKIDTMPIAGFRRPS